MRTIKKRGMAWHVHFSCSRAATFWRPSGARWRLLPTIVNRSLSVASLSKPSTLINCSLHQNYGSSNSFLLSPLPTRHISTDNVFYPVIHATETSFKLVHSFTHLPWWGVVVSTTIVLRCILTLPLAVHQNKTITKMELLLPTLKEYQEAVKHNIIVKCRRANLPVEEANRRLKKAAKEVAKDLYAQKGCSPYRVALLPWVQLPLWITLSFALRNMAGAFPGRSSPAGVEATLSTEGCLWFQDLTLPDPYHVLPIILVASNLCNIELHALRRQTPSRSRRIFTNSLRVLSVAMLYVATQMPAVMTLYWATSSTFGLVQNILFNFPRVRRGLKIPRTPSESQTPFRDLWAVAREKTRAFLILQRETSQK